MVGEPDRERYLPYQVPSGGPALLLLGSALDDPRQPFVAVREDGGAPRRPDILQHSSGARGIQRALLRSPTVPDLGAVSLRDVRFELGRARLRLEWDGPAAPVGVSRPLVISARDGGHRRLDSLSGGQRQRALVAQGLAQEADLLLLDEPAAGLDLEARLRIDDALAHECLRGVTVVRVTHDLAVAQRADHCLLLHDGRVAAQGAPSAVLADVAVRWAWGLTGLR